MSHRAFPHLKALPAHYHVKATPTDATRRGGLCIAGKLHTKTQRQRRTFERHVRQLRTGQGVRVIAYQGHNEIVVLMDGDHSPQPNFYGIHPPSVEYGQQGWFPVHPDDPVIPACYRQTATLFQHCRINEWGEEELQYDST